MIKRTKKGQQTMTDKQRRNMDVRHDMLGLEQTDTESISPFVIFFAVFFRHGFGKRFLKGGILRVFIRMFLFCMVGFIVHYYVPLLPAWMMQNMLTAIALFPFMAGAFLIMFLFRKFKRGLHSLRNYEIHNWHSGTSYFLPIGAWWIRQMNKGAVGIQKVWSATLSKKNKFAPREDVFYNDVGVTRKVVEPFFALLIGLLFFFLKLPLVGFWFLGTALKLNRTAINWLEKYHTHYDNMQDEELVMKGSAELMDRSNEVGKFMSDTQRLIDRGDDEAIDKYMDEFEKKATAKQKHQATPPPADIPPPVVDDFSLDAAFDALKAKGKNTKQ